MSEHDYHGQDSELQAPAKLVEALRRLDTPSILVPPQIDDAALSRPRLHLARIRQHLAHGEMPAATRDEDLALAARTEESRSPTAIRSQERLPPLGSERTQRSKIIICAIVAVLAAAALLLWAYWKHSPR